MQPRPHHEAVEGVDWMVRDHRGRMLIRTDIDQRFRRGLLEAVTREGGQQARYWIAKALEDGPSPGGVQESVRYFGNGLQPKLLLTAQTVEGIEITLPGFGKWLAATGFGNDKTMIKGFVAWAERANGRGKVIGAAKRAFEQ